MVDGQKIQCFLELDKDNVFIRETTLDTLPEPDSEVATGLGDVFHSVLNPIASFIDSNLKTNLSNCPDCQQRREKLNQLFPFNR